MWLFFTNNLERSLNAGLTWGWLLSVRYKEKRWSEVSYFINRTELNRRVYNKSSIPVLKLIKTDSRYIHIGRNWDRDPCREKYRLGYNRFKWCCTHIGKQWISNPFPSTINLVSISYLTGCSHFSFPVQQTSSSVLQSMLLQFSRKEASAVTEIERTADLCNSNNKYFLNLLQSNFCWHNMFYFDFRTVTMINYSTGLILLNKFYRYLSNFMSGW